MLHSQPHDILRLRITISMDDAYEVQGEDIMVDWNNGAKFVSALR